MIHPVSAIDIFFDDQPKEKNDQSNKNREELLQSLSEGNIPRSYFSDRVFGSKWSSVNSEWRTLIDRLCPVSFDEYTVVRRGGRLYRYDFEVSYRSRNQIVHTEQIEFKKNGSSLFTTTQILQVSAFKPFLSGYPLFYYDYFLPDLVRALPYILPIPSWNIYKKEVVKSTSLHPFFSELNRVPPHTKNQVVAHSIEMFLNRFSSTVSLLDFSSEVKSTMQKTFVLWIPSTRQMKSERLLPQYQWKYNGITHNKLMIHSEMYSWNALLRWKNNNGLLNPAWQIAVKALKK